MSRVLERVLVANRGEIAVRIVRTLRRLGIASVAVHSDADVGARHVADADLAVRLGPAPARDSYLHVGRIVDAAVATGADAVHPGYGFLAENPALAEACAAAGLVFVGPPAAAITTMGDKIRAKALVAGAGVPVVPGSEGHGLSDEELAAAAASVGYPVVLKPAAGGGGKGMRVVADAGELAGAAAAARREAVGAFGDGTLLVERFVDTPRHLEIQVLADSHGSVVHLGERECSLQRRHQKIVEEAPSPLLDDGSRAAMGEAAVAVARACGYVGAGTVEFIVSAGRPEEFFFMEMNTRLQVEHPVTEMVHGLDLVEWQLRVAAGERLGFTQDELVASGHAVEARVYAEDPATGFLPTGGTVLAAREPTGREGVRVDSGLSAGTEVGRDYDPMLAKVVAHGSERAEALGRLDAALAETAVLGVVTNVGFLRALLAHPDVAAGRLDTGLVDRCVDELAVGDAPEWLPAAAAVAWLGAGPVPVDPWDRRDGWTVSGPRPIVVAVDVDRGRSVAAEHRVELECVDAHWWAVVDEGERFALALTGGDEPRAGDGTPRRWTVDVDATRRHLDSAVAPDGSWWIAHEGRTWSVRVEEPWEAHRDDRAVGHHGPVVAPMPGALLEVHVVVGDSVVGGQPLAAVEAMKMEFVLRAPFDGTITAVHAAAGDAVALGQPVVTVDDATSAASTPAPGETDPEG